MSSADENTVTLLTFPALSLQMSKRPAFASHPNEPPRKALKSNTNVKIPTSATPKKRSAPAIVEDLPSLTPVQLAAVRQACAPNATGGLFITGEAGAGKSVCVRAIIKELKKNVNNKIYVTATTGVAAIELPGGTTLASFMGTGISGDSKDLEWVMQFAQDIRKGKCSQNGKALWRVRDRIQQATHLIVDEISMASTQFLDNMQTILGIVRGYPSKPFGGLRLIFTGDFAQLPPVIKAADLDLDRTFAFQSDAWKHVTLLELPGTHRQTNATWSNMLSRIRRGIMDDDIVAALQARVLPPPADELVTHIYPHNATVDKINGERLAELQGVPHVFEAEDETTMDTKFDPFKDCRSLKKITLKAGAQVMLLSNLRSADLQMVGCFSMENTPSEEVILANGSVGKVVRFEHSDPERKLGQEWPVVYFPRSKGKVPLEVRIEPREWTKMETPRGPVVASRTQVPLLLSYAVSAHKCQGLTITCPVVADIGRAFEFGQAYVMLSRVREITQLHLASFHPDAVKAHPAVGKYYGL